MRPVHRLHLRIALRSHDDLVNLVKWGEIPLADALLYAMIELSVVNEHLLVTQGCGGF